jgi:flagellar basal body-associated protein FliL
VSDIPPSYTGQPPENQTPGYKAAKLAVIVLSVLILLALVALVVGAIRSMSGKHPAAHGATSTFQLAPGARIVEMQSQPGRLILRVRDKEGEEIDILDVQDGRLVGQVKAPFSK